MQCLIKVGFLYTAGFHWQHRIPVSIEADSCYINKYTAAVNTVWLASWCIPNFNIRMTETFWSNTVHKVKKATIIPPCLTNEALKSQIKHYKSLVDMQYCQWANFAANCSLLLITYELSNLKHIWWVQKLKASVSEALEKWLNNQSTIFYLFLSQLEM